MPSEPADACGKDRALHLLAELVLNTRAQLATAIATRDAEALREVSHQLDRFALVCETILNPPNASAPAWRSRAGKLGGASTLQRHGTTHYARMGRLGAIARHATRTKGEDA